MWEHPIGSSSSSSFIPFTFLIASATVIIAGFVRDRALRRISCLRNYAVRIIKKQWAVRVGLEMKKYGTDSTSNISFPFSCSTLCPIFAFTSTDDNYSWSAYPFSSCCPLYTFILWPTLIIGQARDEQACMRLRIIAKSLIRKQPECPFRHDLYRLTKKHEPSHRSLLPAPFS